MTPTTRPLRLAFNRGYLDDALAAQDSDVVRVGVTSPSQPVIFRTGAGYLHVLCPVTC